MKKILLIFIILFLFSCKDYKNNLEKNIKIQEEKNINKNKENLQKEIKIGKNLNKYGEIDLDIDQKSEEFQNNAYILDEKFKDNIKKIYNGELKDFNKFEKLKRLSLNCGKYFEKCPNGKFGFTKKELKKLFKGVFTEFFIDSKNNIYIFNKVFVLKNKKEIVNFENKNIELFEGANGAFSDIGVYNNKLGFTFYYLDKENNLKYKKLNCDDFLERKKKENIKCENILKKEGNNEKYIKCYENLDKNKIYDKCINLLYDDKFIKENTFYNNGFLNEKYKIDSSKKIFIYSGKIGFIAEKKEKKVIIFDGKIITKNFDNIKTQTCCMSFAYPFYIFNNGLISFVFERGGRFFIGYNYLK